MIPSLTNQQFIEKANKVHNNKYDYSEVEYINNYTKVSIKCLQHGIFIQSPMSHLQGNGCKECANIKQRLERSISNPQFIEKAIKVHGNKYNYDKVQYVNNQTKVIITCPTHGDFNQTPAIHLRGNGCSICNGAKLSQEEFIKRSRLIHGDKYDYSKIKYTGILNKVVITCLKHGDYEQRPSHHLRGNNCPKCNLSKGELAIKAILDKYNIKYIQEYKIPGTNYRFEYDFYLPDLNVIIEFHGGQHFFPVKHFGGDEYFKYIKKCDMFKKELAKLVNIPIIEFDYKQLKKMSKEQFEELVIKNIRK